MIDKIKSLDKSLIKITILVAFFHAVGYQLSFAIDTFYTFWMGFEEAGRDMLYRNGRPVIAVIYRLFGLTGWPSEWFYYISFGMAMIFLIAAVYLYHRIINKYIQNENLSILLSFVSISNIFIIEYFMFIEKGGFMVGVFLNVLTVYFVEQYMESANKKYIAFAIIAAIFGILTYQGIMALSFILLMPLIYKHSQTVKEYLKYFLINVVIYWIPVLIDLILFKIWFSDARTTDVDVIANGIRAFNTIVESYWQTYHVMPAYFYVVVMALILVINIIAVAHNKKNIVSGIGNVLITFMATTWIPTASIFAGSGWGCPRILYPMASGVGIFLINYYINGKISSETKLGIVNKVLVGILLCFLFVQYISFTNIYCDKYRLNFADEIRCLEIGQAIQEYEIESGNKVEEIAFYFDQDMQSPFYPGVFDDGDLVMTAFFPWDSQLNIINYYLGTDYKRGFATEAYTEYFASFDWNTFSEKQMVFEGNTLHYCVY